MDASVADRAETAASEGAADHEHRHGPMGAMIVGAIGVVFGDIGTSPLYSLQQTFVGHHPLAVDKLHIYGVLCLIVWTLVVVVMAKYVWLIMRADNKGEGGSLALLALIQRRSGVRKWTGGLVMLGIAATALFFGDAIITPAISVLSAVEGLAVVSPKFTPLVVPISLGILAGLFMIQARGTAAVGKLFGPVMILYFITIGILGAYNIALRPQVVEALNPVWAVRFFAADPRIAFLALGSVVLAVTGAEALYADMGHFGRKPISYAWYGIFAMLVLNYLGQSALLLTNPKGAENPFFLMVPEKLRLPMVFLATGATIIASQAVITGTYSVARQAIQLGFVPRLKITHTSERTAGQIYVPIVNWGLAVMVILLVLGFGSSSNLAAAYGIAVTGTMFITTCMLAVLSVNVWKWPLPLAIIVVGFFWVIDGTYFASNLTKIPAGGWFPLLVGVIVFTLLTTWAKGRTLLINRMNEATLPIEVFIKSAAGSAARVPGTAVFMTSAATGVPHALLHNLKHNKVLHERIVLLTVRIEEVPHVAEEKRIEMVPYGSGFYRVLLRYGFMEEIDVPAALSKLQDIGAQCKMMDTSFFLARQTLLASSRPGMAIWREKLFAWMLRNAESAMEFFKLPTNRVVELGSQVEI